MVDYDVIIIGAGPAGLFCAANLNESVLVLDRMPSPGKKLLISGSGQCNLTHEEPIANYLTHYGDHGSFVKPALMACSFADTCRFFEAHGVPLETTDEGKVFPQSRDANDVLRALLDAVRGKVRCGAEVTAVAWNDGIFTVTTDDRSFTSNHLVIATGGKSYPHTGSNGSGYQLAASLGHTIVEPKEALTPVYVKNFPLQELSGISFPNAKIQIWRSGKKLKETAGDLLITRFGFSGPGILNASRWMQKKDVLKLSFIGLTEAEFDAVLVERTQKDGGKLVSNIFYNLGVPERLVKTLAPPEVKCAQLSAPERRRLVKAFCSYEAEIDHLGGFTAAMATAGGVSLDEVNRKTCESKLIPGLFFAGEVLDIDGDTGGYNIQAAFSTARLIAQKISARTTE